MRNRRGLLAGLHISTMLVVLCAPVAGAAAPGADCCADLESRIALLEATVARKGNRAVALEVSGLVNQAMLGWDDRAESNVYVVTNDNARTRFRFLGAAAITPEWQVGYRLDLGIRAANSKIVNQLGAQRFNSSTLDIRDTVWFLRGKSYGTLFIGTTFPSFTGVADSNVTQTDWFTKYGGVENTGLNMFLRSSRNGELASTLTWRRIIGAGGNQPGETQRGLDLVKYVSPTWNGFTAAASLVADDFWDATLRYNGEVAGLKIAAAAGYLDLMPGSRSRGVCALNPFAQSGDAAKCRQVGGSFSVLHQQTGMFLNLGAGLTMEGLLQDTARFAGTGVDDSELFWSGQAGIEGRINTLGKSTLYGEFYRYGGGAPAAVLVGPRDALNPTGVGNWTVWKSDIDVVGGGLAQGIDSTSTILYLAYRHVRGDVTLRQLQGVAATGAFAGAPIDDLDLLLAGAIINF